VTIQDGVIVDETAGGHDADSADSQHDGSLIDMTNKTLVRPHLLSPEISDVLKLSVGTMQVIALRPGSLVGVDSSGSLESVLGVEIEGRKLVVDTLAVNEVASDVDMAGHVLHNVKLGKSVEFSAPLQGMVVHNLQLLSPSVLKEAAALVGVNEDGTAVKIESVAASKERLRVDSMLHVSQDAVIEGSVTALGTVMGTGPYVDASDRRFKTDPKPLTGATGIISKLQAVRISQKTGFLATDIAAAKLRSLTLLVLLCVLQYTYRYDSENFPHKKFSTRTQIGWMAQDVREVVPELVETDENGFLSVAYARAVPILAEALKSLQHKVEELEQQLKELQSSCK
jgi:hypothetical protein